MDVSHRANGCMDIWMNQTQRYLLNTESKLKIPVPVLFEVSKFIRTTKWAKMVFALSL